MTALSLLTIESTNRVSNRLSHMSWWGISEGGTYLKVWFLGGGLIKMRDYLREGQFKDLQHSESALTKMFDYGHIFTDVAAAAALAFKTKITCF